MSIKPALILVVDDYKLHRDLMSQTLEAEGYRATTANDGFEAMKKVSATRPDLVLLDVSMPKLDGIQVLKQLRADPTTELLPVILVTAHRSTLPYRSSAITTNVGMARAIRVIWQAKPSLNWRGFSQ